MKFNDNSTLGLEIFLCQPEPMVAPDVFTAGKPASEGISVGAGGNQDSTVMPDATEHAEFNATQTEGFPTLRQAKDTPERMSTALDIEALFKGMRRYLEEGVVPMDLVNQSMKLITTEQLHVSR